jgi:acetyl esterase/lipase
VRVPWLLLGAMLASTGAVAEPAPMPVEFSAVLELRASAPAQRLTYGPSPSQHATLWLPEDAEAAAVVVLLHGGCWLSDYSAPHVFPLAEQLTRDGFAVWVPEYRRVGEAGGGWPGTFEDVGAALAALEDLAGEQLDRARVALVGHSAGGHLALWLAAQEPGAGVTPRAVIGLAAITDLVAYAAGSNSCQQVTPRLMGGTPEERPDRYAAASPAALAVRMPTLLLRGSLDGIVGADQLTAMPESALLAHRTLEGVGHFDLIHPGTPAYGVFLSALRDLLAVPAP